jgi:L-aspartate oxidase
LEGLVFGARAAQTAGEYARRLGRQPSALGSPPTSQAKRPGGLDEPEKLRSSLRRLMWGKVGLVRTGDSLAGALAQLTRWERLVDQPFGTRGDLEVKNMVQVARCIAEAALWRTNSIGAHYRADYPQLKRAGWNRHSVIVKDGTVTGIPATTGQRAASRLRRM